MSDRPELAEAQACAQLSALAHEGRLRIFRALVAAGPKGLAAGMLAEQLAISPSNLSAHLAVLTAAGLAQVEKAGRQRIYAANLVATAELVSFLIADCCGGDPALCRDVTAKLAVSALRACN
ncbi:AsrR family transcriptional regulator [Glycocaulis alkaliphilus]|uniref:AsrR family transcriptional regulator n=1 Tax=Glycocaulis alkaliphilus TaxID=1434191 RepID=A0A3T0EDN5_9PROT|nr:metalloregulator ArsR/SmtB family transcription factor [Glycocaulis alkaliphilus]AZU05411.1 AsrR family transcriptional regulator [Glycocaulis alkaliphilus]GGB80878.1 transcriptional regulator [Glycocaulis alkaliphilus]